MLNKEKFSTPFFITTSIVVLLLLFGFYFFGGLSLNGVLFAGPSNNNEVNVVKQNDDFKVGDDPYLTRKLDLKDMLKGPIISQNDPIFGKKEAEVALVVFSDFQCGICHKQEAVFKKIMERYKDKVKMIWKDYPDKNSNSNSFQASLAGRCANEQNKFWEYHDLLFANSNALNNNKFVEIAGQLGLDKNEFETCLSTGKYKKQVNDNVLEANALDITGVPFIYVNTQEVMGEIGFEELEKLVQKELAR